MDNHTNGRLSQRDQEKKPAKHQKAASQSTKPSDGDDATSNAIAPASYETASHALNLRDMAAAGWLYWITSTTLAEKINPDAFKLYRDIMLHEAGNPSDPIERMLIEQLALAHFSIGQLRIRSCSTESPKMAIAFADAATRLLGELRRCSLALEDYRAKQAARKEQSGRQGDTGSGAAPREEDEFKPSPNGNKALLDTELEGHNNGDIPEWLNKRIMYPGPKTAQPAAATAGVGKG